jgi:hypothetical protein
MAVHLARIDPHVFFLTTFSFAQQLAQEPIELVKCLVGEILRQFKEMRHQQRLASILGQIQEGLRLIFAAFVCQLQDPILVQCRRQSRQRKFSQEQKTLNQSLDTFGRSDTRSLP